MHCCQFEPGFRELAPLHQGEEGIDAGGLTREWYTILAREIFNPNIALFEISPSGRDVQPALIGRQGLTTIT